MSRFRTTRRALLAGGGLLAMGGAAWWGYGEWDRAAAGKDILSWMKDNTRRFDSARPASIMADGAMVRALAGAKVIGIGEVTHGSHEDVACKVEIIKGLVKAGAIGTVFLEANSNGGRQLDAFIGGAEGSAAERVISADIFRVLKADALIDLVDWLRDWNRGKAAPVRIIGVDCQATAVDTIFALDWLRTVDAPAADAFARRLEPFINPAARAKRYVDLITGLTTKQLRQGMTDLTELQGALAPDGPYANASGRAAAAQSVRSAWQGLHILEYETSDGKFEGDTDAYFGRRDVYMAQNIQHFADDKPGAYWAHNLHVAAASVALDAETYTPAGHHLKQALGERYKTILFEYASARFNAVPIRDPSKPVSAMEPNVVIDWPYRPGRLAELFRSIGGGDAWVDLAALPDTKAIRDWSNTPCGFRAPGYAAPEKVDDMPVERMRPRPAIDVLVHVEALTPSRMRV